MRAIPDQESSQLTITTGEIARSHRTLPKFPFHKIKIDQSFVRRMERDPESKAIVRAVAALGASLGMTTTAEGVETPEQFDLVRAEGCTHVQGYLTGKPMGAADAAAMVAFPLPLEFQGAVL